MKEVKEMGLKVIHNEIIKCIGLKTKKIGEIYDYISESNKLSKLGINYVNFGEAMAKLERLDYVHIPDLRKKQTYTLSNKGVKIYLNMIEKEK